MVVKELSDSRLLFEYSQVLAQMTQLYKQKKEIESEIADRNELLRLKVQRGEIV